MKKGTNSNAQANTSRWGPRMILILIAMLTVSMAFFSGLYVQAGLPFFPSLIGGFAIFVTLFGSLPRKKQAPASDDLRARFALFENEMVSLSDQLEQFQGLSGKMGQLDELAPTLLQLEGFVKEMKTQGVAMAREQGADNELKISEFSEKLKQLDGRIADLNHEVADKDKGQQKQLQTHIESLDKLVRQMGREDIPPQQPSPSAIPQFDHVAADPEPTPAPSATPESFAPTPGDVLPAQSEKTVDQIRQRIDASKELLHQNMADTKGQSNEDRMLSVVSKAIKQRRVDIFLQPVVSLPKRKTIYYEVFTRLRNDANNLILPELFVPVAEQAGLMPLIDNMMLLRAIKIIRRMDQQTSAKGLFCSLSTQSLVDPDFFPKLVEFLENNRDLSGRIIFEIAQSQKKTAGPLERDGMRHLARLGFSFSLDKVTDLDIDFDDLARMNFKFVRISADRLINGMAELGARIHGADKAHYLKRFGIDLIVERIETERELATLADYSISLGQGYLFAEPRPIRPEVIGRKAAA
jgi:EAL domain-containing protein (putative c-di-GMP-specific phosphodiesterase class I)